MFNLCQPIKVHNIFLVDNLFHLTIYVKCFIFFFISNPFFFSLTGECVAVEQLPELEAVDVEDNRSAASQDDDL